MSKQKTGSQRGKVRLLKQLEAKRNQKDLKKVQDVGKQPVSRIELFNVQNTLNIRTDSALMGVAAIIKLLVKAKTCTYEDFEAERKSMTSILKLIRKSMEEGYKELGQDTKPENIGAFVYEKVLASGVDKEVLINIFGVKPSESRILKPSQVKSIVTLK